LGFFTVVGIQAGRDNAIHIAACIASGAIKASYGGVIRDITLSNIPLIFQKEIYATTCILGGVIFFLLLKIGVPKMPVEVICLVTIVLFRLLSVRYHWQLPVIWKPVKPSS